MDLYTSFAHLSRGEREGRDYRIRWRMGGSGVAIVAPHGGGIERGTSALALLPRATRSSRVSRCT